MIVLPRGPTFCYLLRKSQKVGGKRKGGGGDKSVYGEGGVGRIKIKIG
jgi:hypothetical protein